MIEAAPAAKIAHRGTIFVEDATIVSIEHFPADQQILRLHAPRCASGATAGSFVHIQCSNLIPMRRPLSIMRANAAEGWIEVLYKVIGQGLQALGEHRTGDRVDLIGPIGRGFKPDSDRPRHLLIGGGIGIPPMIFLAEQTRKDAGNGDSLVLMGSEVPFPFELEQSHQNTPWLDAGISTTIPLLEKWGITARLASLSDFDGCFRGYVTDLARRYLESLSPAEIAGTEIFTCGPTPMLRAVAALASEFGLPCQVSLEEFMACGVGGCAGCTVLVQGDEGPAMKRVCVDGPVFMADRVFT